MKKKWYQRIPNTFVILLVMIVVGALLTWIVPAGEFSRVEHNGRMIIEPGTYHAVERNPASFFDIFAAIPEGLEGASQIIIMILISSGTFGVINSTGAIENAIGVLIRKTKNAHIPGSAVVFIITILFACLGIIVGPEIQIPFTTIAVSIALGLGFDLLTGAAMVIVGGGVGFALAPINASTIGTCDSISGLPLFSGMGLRTMVWACGSIASALLLVAYTRKITKDPSKSLTLGIDSTGLGLSKELEDYKLTGRDKRVLAVFLVLFAFLIIGPTYFKWYLNEMSAMFVIAAIAVAIVAKINVEDTLNSFMKGAGSMIGAAMMVGLGRAIQVVMQDGRVLDTIINTISMPLMSCGSYMSAILMTLIHGVVNFIIPSGSGQAAATMPIMFPVGELAGITAQTSILAFQVGDGVTNLIYPTLGSLMAMLGIARVPFGKWVKFAIKAVVLLYVISWIFLLIAVKIQWGPF